MTSPDTTAMGIREKLSENRNLGTIAGVGLCGIAAILIARTYWPHKQADLNQAWYTTDDGKTWFPDSTFRVAPFDHGGKEAVVAHVYSYADGSRDFCGYLAKFTPEAKAKLEAAIAEAQKAGKSPGTVGLWSDRGFMTHGVLVKKPNESVWVTYDDPKASAVFAITSPDGSAVDERFVK